MGEVTGFGQSKKQAFFELRDRESGATAMQRFQGAWACFRLLDESDLRPADVPEEVRNDILPTTVSEDFSYFQQKIPSSDYVPLRSSGGSAVAEEYRVTLEAVDGQRSVCEVERGEERAVGPEPSVCGDVRQPGAVQRGQGAAQGLFVVETGQDNAVQ